jgi:hypothetical protein
MILSTADPIAGDNGAGKIERLVHDQSRGLLVSTAA